MSEQSDRYADVGAREVERVRVRQNQQFLTEGRRVALDRAVDEIVAAGSSIAWLQHRWDLLNRERPPMDWWPNVGHADVGAGSRLLEDVEVVPDRIVAFADDEMVWGVLNNRYGSFGAIADRLVAARASDSYGGWLEFIAATRLVAMEGPCGSLYSVVDGRHRTHVLRAVAPPSVIIRRVESMRTWAAGDRAHVATGPPTGQALDDGVFQRLLRLRDAGVIEDVTRSRGRYVRSGPGGSQARMDFDIWFTICRDLPVLWALESPATVVAITEMYCRVYPGFADDPVGRLLLDPLRWQQYLLGQR